MTYNEKKSLYESIMKDVAKTVKQHLNEKFAGADFIPSEIESLVAELNHICNDDNTTRSNKMLK